MIESLQKALTQLRQKKPLVLCLTNSVTQDFVANCLLSLGAAPIMSACEEELEELIKLSSSVYLNIGTLDRSFIHLSEKAIEGANRYKKPIILDPVGAGASQLRTKTARAFSSFSSIVRANASEIIALTHDSFTTKGVESTTAPLDAFESAKAVSKKHDLTVIVSGKTDLIVKNNSSQSNDFGSPLMQYVTGMGCSMTGVVAAFHGMIDDSFEASFLATTYFSLCGELASRQATAPGSFKTAFIDQLYHSNFDEMRDLYVQRG